MHSRNDHRLCSIASAGQTSRLSLAIQWSKNVARSRRETCIHWRQWRRCCLFTLADVCDASMRSAISGWRPSTETSRAAPRSRSLEPLKTGRDPQWGRVVLSPGPAPVWPSQWRWSWTQWSSRVVPSPGTATWSRPPRRMRSVVQPGWPPASPSRSCPRNTPLASAPTTQPHWAASCLPTMVQVRVPPPPPDPSGSGGWGPGRLQRTPVMPSAFTMHQSPLQEGWSGVQLRRVWLFPPFWPRHSPAPAHPTPVGLTPRSPTWSACPATRLAASSVDADVLGGRPPRRLCPRGPPPIGVGPAETDVEEHHVKLECPMSCCLCTCASAPLRGTWQRCLAE